MTRSIGLKVAASAVAIGLALATWPAAEAMRPASDAAKSVRHAADAARQAGALAVKHNFAAALPFAEQAVAASPRDAGYRMLLADLYLKNGRYQSAATTYRDVVTLDPSNQRAALSLALCEVTQGHDEAAVAILDSVAGTAPVADVGLAYAIAGQPQRAIALLEPAAHGLGSTGRLRQNLAFAYALAGDWEKARTTASQDMSPADLGPRLEQWARLAKPASPADSVAALLGVRPAADAGQPERLALNEAPAGTALATTDPAPAPQPAAAPAEASVQVAAAQPAAAPVAAPEPQPKAEVAAQAVYANATPAVAKPQHAVLRAGAAARLRLAGFELPQSKPAHPVTAGTGRFAVQLGAFSSAANVERAWASELKRYGFDQFTPFSTTINVPGKGTLHRLSVAGFASRGDAERTCRSIRAKGGACFVRAVAGDEPTRWASRYASHKTAIASR